MGKNYKWKVMLVFAVVAFSIWKAYPPQQKINLGLDLQGGMQLLLQIETEKVPAEHREDATDRVVEIIRNRIDELGVKEPLITKQGKDKVVVQLPGITDRDRAKEIIGRTAHLEFRLVADDPEILQKAAEGTLPENFEHIESKEGHELLLDKEAVLTGDRLTTASVGFDEYGQPVVNLQFNKEGSRIFDRVTSQNIGKQLAIVLDGKTHSEPVLRERIPNGQAQISGNFTAEEAGDLALVLRAGALPAPVRVIEERTVGPTLGRDSIEKGIRAGILGAVLVFIFMPAYYLLAGFVANIGLLVYMVMVIGSLAMLQAALTLPGIAGFILSIGMAVDANILIAERIREERESGKTAKAAISAGYHRAFAAILDSNVTIFITAMILLIFGTGPIKGFAVTLGLGQIASMFSSLTVTRVVLDFLAHRNPNLNLKMMKWIGVTHIHFLRGRYLAYGFSLLTLILGVSSFFLRGQENFGVEFTGGTSVQLGFKNAVDSGAFRKSLERQGVSDPTLQHYGSASENQFLIKSQRPDTREIEKAAEAIAGKDYEILRVDEVGPAVSEDLKKKALWALFWTSLGILIYLGFRFEMKFAWAAVAALLHDILFTFGVYALSGREISLSTVAALLTIMGYSVNDTIVIFDRVRENLKVMRHKPFSEIVEVSLNQSFSRTIFTSMNVLFGAFALLLLGGGGIQDFAFTLCVGLSVGIYSTIFVASALVVDWSRSPKLKQIQAE